jgi:hypothetical protein
MHINFSLLFLLINIIDSRTLYYPFILLDKMFVHTGFECQRVEMKLADELKALLLSEMN